MRSPARIRSRMSGLAPFAMTAIRPQFIAISPASSFVSIPPRPPAAGPAASALSSGVIFAIRSEEHTSELQSRLHLVCRLLLEKKKKIHTRLALSMPHVNIRLILHAREPSIRVIRFHDVNAYLAVSSTLHLSSVHLCDPRYGTC